MEKKFNSKQEMAKQFYEIVIKYIRLIRAFNFKDPKTDPDYKDSILGPLDTVRLIEELILRFSDSRYFSVKKLDEILKALKFLYSRLELKQRNDENLSEDVNPFFNECLKKLKSVIDNFEAIVTPRKEA